MSKVYWATAAAVLALSSAQAIAEEASPAADNKVLLQAKDLLRQRQPAQVLETVAPLVSRFDSQIAEARTKGMAFCAPSMVEGFLYGSLASTQKKTSIIFGPEMCQAYFLKSFALIDLGRKEEGLVAFQDLNALAPMNGHYMLELAHAYRINNQLDKSQEAYTTALGYADFAEDEPMKAAVRAAARRGIGWCLFERGDLKGAEKSYKLSLKDDPNSEIAKSELKLIAERRNK